MNLVYRDRAGETRAYSLAGRPRVTVGREAGRELVLAEGLVSRHHATIENIHGNYLLRDAGSSNGTFLNGLRLSKASSIMLREGDVIEIGSTALVVSHDPRTAEAPLRTRSEKGEETTFPLGDLLLDGLAAFRARPEGEHQAWEDVVAALTKERAVAGAGTTSASRETLAPLAKLVAEQGPLDGVVIFLKNDKGALELAATHPDPRRAARLEELARRTFEARGARSFCPRVLIEEVGESQAFDETHETQHVLTSAAVALLAPDGACLGAIAVERFVRLDRSDVALLAVYGHRIAHALSPRVEEAV